MHKKLISLEGSYFSKPCLATKSVAADGETPSPIPTWKETNRVSWCNRDLLEVALWILIHTNEAKIKKNLGKSQITWHLHPTIISYSQ